MEKLSNFDFKDYFLYQIIDIIKEENNFLFCLTYINYKNNKKIKKWKSNFSNIQLDDKIFLLKNYYYNLNKLIKIKMFDNFVENKISILFEYLQKENLFINGKENIDLLEIKKKEYNKFTNFIENVLIENLINIKKNIENTNEINSDLIKNEIDKDFQNVKNKYDETFN